MREAAIVSTARTGIGKAYRGAFNITHGATLAGHAVEHAVKRARIDPGEVDDVVLAVEQIFPELSEAEITLCVVRDVEQRDGTIAWIGHA